MLNLEPRVGKELPGQRREERGSKVVFSNWKDSSVLVEGGFPPSGGMPLNRRTSDFPLPQLYGNHLSHIHVHLQHSHLRHDVPHIEGEVPGDVTDDGAQLPPPSPGGARAGVLEGEVGEGRWGGGGWEDTHSQAESWAKQAGPGKGRNTQLTFCFWISKLIFSYLPLHNMIIKPNLVCCVEGLFARFSVVFYYIQLHRYKL